MMHNLPVRRYATASPGREPGENPMAPVRGYFVWGISTLLICGALVIWSMAGWPPNPDSCTNIDPDTHVQVLKKIDGTDYPDIVHPDTCYCEAFRVEDVVSGKPGIRQWTNTLSNVYAIVTSLILVGLIARAREKRRFTNLFDDPDSWVPELYVFAVLFLGLGSMWLHASLSSTVSWADGMSMYVFTCFLPLYTFRRRYQMKYWFYIIYVGAVALFTTLNVLPGMEDASTLLIMVIIAAYIFAEIWVKHLDLKRIGCERWFNRLRIGLCKGGWMRRALLFWTLGLVSFGLAAFFRGASQTGYWMCTPDSWFQPHGLLWHSLSGVMAMMLYFYWRTLPDEEMRWTPPTPDPET
jgi:hypothetical protein